MSATTIALIVVMLLLLYGGVSFMRNRMPLRGGALALLSGTVLVGLVSNLLH